MVCHVVMIEPTPTAEPDANVYLENEIVEYNVDTPDLQETIIVEYVDENNILSPRPPKNFDTITTEESCEYKEYGTSEPTPSTSKRALQESMEHHLNISKTKSNDDTPRKKMKYTPAKKKRIFYSNSTTMLQKREMFL